MAESGQAQSIGIGRRCVAGGCFKSDSIRLHFFQFDRPAVLRQWIQFVQQHRQRWPGPLKTSVLYSLFLPRMHLPSKSDWWNHRDKSHPTGSKKGCNSHHPDEYTFYESSFISSSTRKTPCWWDTIDQHPPKAKKSFPQERDTAGKFYDINVSNFCDPYIVWVYHEREIERERQRQRLWGERENLLLIGKCAVWLI